MTVIKKIAAAAVIVFAVLACVSCTYENTADISEETWYFDRAQISYTPPTEEEIRANPPEEKEGLSALKSEIEEYISTRGGEWGSICKKS